MRSQGRITTWKDDRGFGFISSEDIKEPVYVHIKSFTNRQRRPTVDELITFEVLADAQGRLQAKDVAFAGEQLKPSRRTRHNSSAPLFAASFLFFICAAVLSEKLPLAVLITYVIASLITFVVYSFDKAAAVLQQWRVSEGTLHSLGLFGGWPGAMFAQRFLRHKCSKMSFLVTFWATVIVNCMAVVWLMSPWGTAMLRTVLSAY